MMQPLATRFTEMIIVGAILGVLLAVLGVSGWWTPVIVGSVLGSVSAVQEATGLSMMRVVRRLPHH